MASHRILVLAAAAVRGARSQIRPHVQARLEGALAFKLLLRLRREGLLVLARTVAARQLRQGLRLRIGNGCYLREHPTC